MVLKADALDEIKVGVKDFLRRMPAQHAYQQRYYALNYERVALRREVYLAVHVVRLQPHAALAAVNEVVLGLILVVELLQVIAQVNQQLVLVHPVGKVSKLLYYLVLCFVYCHNLYLFIYSSIIRQRPRRYILQDQKQPFSS